MHWGCYYATALDIEVDPQRRRFGCRESNFALQRLVDKLPLWRGAGGGGVLAGTRRQSAAGDGVPPSLQIPPDTHILLARSPAPYSPFRRRAHSPTAFSGPMARPPPSPPRPPPSHMHAGWMVSATKTPTSSAPSQRFRNLKENRMCAQDFARGTF